MQQFIDPRRKVKIFECFSKRHQKNSNHQFAELPSLFRKWIFSNKIIEFCKKNKKKKSEKSTLHQLFSRIRTIDFNKIIAHNDQEEVFIRIWTLTFSNRKFQSNNEKQIEDLKSLSCFVIIFELTISIHFNEWFSKIFDDLKTSPTSRRNPTKNSPVIPNCWSFWTDSTCCWRCLRTSICLIF